ncbi:MAG: YggT family protein [Novosphingobium sp.]|jgi:YggT family protein|uniref:YggT family protein n=1 Tax=Novosphingobium sp. TaxID=1874826 RepID=UPI003019351F
MLLFSLIAALIKLIQLIQMVVVVQFILSMLIAFNVVSARNKVVSAIWTALSAILDPILNPIRRAMPNTGAIDFSPMIVIFGLDLIVRVLVFIADMTGSI